MDAVEFWCIFDMALIHHFEFIRGYLRDPHGVGAIAPSSRALAKAVCEPYARHEGPARVLEVGAGTGACTRYLGSILKPEDELDVCEIDPHFADLLERNVLSLPSFAKPIAEGRVRLIRGPAQSITAVDHYDFIICGLPFTSFPVAEVEKVFDVFRRCIRPDGILTYFEYAVVRRLSRSLAVGDARKRVREVSRFMTREIDGYQFAQRIVWNNVPPARARHLRFNGNGR